MGRDMTQFPACRKSPYYDTIKSDPRLGVYYDIVRNARHARTLMPVQGYLMQLLDHAAQHVLYDQRDAQAELDEATRKAQARLEQVVSRLALHEQAQDGAGR